MAIQTEPQLTVAEYLAWEERQECKHEYIDGEIIEMTGGTRKHSRIIINLTLAIGSQLRGSNCVLHSSEMRVKAGDSRYVYPDLSAVCGDELLEDASELTLLNPIFVVEVTSPSSLGYDYVDKLEFYFQVPSVEAYLIVDQDRPYANLYTRAEAGRYLRMFNSLDDVIPLAALNCELPLAQVYHGIVSAGAGDQPLAAGPGN